MDRNTLINIFVEYVKKLKYYDNNNITQLKIIKYLNDLYDLLKISSLNYLYDNKSVRCLVCNKFDVDKKTNKTFPTLDYFDYMFTVDKREINCYNDSFKHRVLFAAHKPNQNHINIIRKNKENNVQFLNLCCNKCKEMFIPEKLITCISCNVKYINNNNINDILNILYYHKMFNNNNDGDYKLF